MAVDLHRARRRIDDAADDADQSRLAGAIRAEQRENLAVADVEVDVFKRLESGGVNLIETRDGNGGRRGGHDGWLKIRSDVGCNAAAQILSFDPNEGLTIRRGQRKLAVRPCVESV